jgi:hypothetical protein
LNATNDGSPPPLRVSTVPATRPLSYRHAFCSFFLLCERADAVAVPDADIDSVPDTVTNADTDTDADAVPVAVAVSVSIEHRNADTESKREPNEVTAVREPDRLELAVQFPVGERVPVAVRDAVSRPICVALSNAVQIWHEDHDANEDADSLPDADSDAHAIADADPDSDADADADSNANRVPD